MGGIVENEEAEQQLQMLLAFNAATLHATIAASVETAIGRTLPQIEVRFKDLAIAADVTVVQTSGQDSHMAELPTIANTVRKSMSNFSLKKHVVRKQILSKMSGVFKPGSLTLVLGQPGSGKSSLMKILSGRFPMSKNVKVEGDISYNGRKQQEFKQRIPQFVSYVNQHDKHFPTMTVKETLKFAHACCGGRLGKHEETFFDKGAAAENESALQMLKILIHYYPEIIIQQLGLQSCQDTIVGDAMLRGISGGQRKRVTTGEMQFGTKTVMIMDEISTGLDSAATFDIVNTQRTVAKQLRKTIIIALLQPSPEVFALFDDVLLLNDGQLMYHGPRDQIAAYFAEMGFVCPPRRDVADFLLDLGTDQQIQYQVTLENNAKHARTATAFATAFQSSVIHQKMLEKVNAPIDTVLVNDMKDFLELRSEFFQTFTENTKTLVKRQLLLLTRNRSFIKGRVVMVIVMGLLYGTTFYQFNPVSIQVVMGTLFSAVLFLSLGQASQIPTIMDARDIFYKQRGANFYRTLSYVLACSVSQFPSAILETLIFGSLVYWMCGFAVHGGSYVVFELLLVVTNLAFTAWFFFIGSIAPNVHVAKPLSMLSILVFVLFAGFVISKEQLPIYMQWLYWIDPVAWCLRSLAVNQYRNEAYDKCEYDGVNYCSLFGKTMGEYYLGLYGVPSEKHWVAWGFVFMIFTYFVFMAISYAVLEFKRYETPELHGSVTHSDETEHAEQFLRNSQREKIEVKPSTTGKPGSVAPMPTKETTKVPPVTLAFKDLWYSVPDPSNPRKESIDLLQGVTGYASPGTMTALMGSSGAGKTTLMDVIAGRKTGGKIRGQILLNGHKATKRAIRRSTGYCEQMDIHCDASTIREALTFSAFLRQPNDVSVQRIKASVLECLELLDLTSIADQIIRGSSTEQMKRLTIGVELAAQPSILFLDEPTSGLDARSAKVIMDGARKVANTGRTIVCTIHQPSSEVFQLFDRLLLLKRGGETVFYGDLGKECELLIQYFEAVPGVTKIQAGSNPATWMLECIGAGVSSGGTSSVNYAELFKSSTLKQVLDAAMCQEGIGKPSAALPELVFKKQFASSPRTQMQFLLKRFMDTYWRTASYNLTRMVIAFILALLFGVIFVGADYKTYQGINSAVGMVFMTTLFNSMISFNSVLPIAAEERAAFYREQASQMYHPFWYFLGSTVAELPYVFASGAFFTAIFYPMVGFIGFINGVLYWINLSLMILLMTYIGQFLAYAMPSIEVAMIMGVLLNSINSLFMGFNPPAASIPQAYKWIYYITPQRYALGNLVVIALGDCPTPGGSEAGCQIVQGAPVVLGTLTVQQYLDVVFGMKHEDIGLNFVILIAFIIGYRVLALLSLCYVNHQKR